jgi:hypothetical protein
MPCREKKSGNDPIRILNRFTERSASCRRIAGVLQKSRLHAGIARTRIRYFLRGFQEPSAALGWGRVASIAVRRHRIRSDTRVISSLRIPGPVRLRIPSRFDFGNHACDARRSAHLPDGDLRSTAQRIHSNAAIRCGAAGSRIHRNRNRFRVSGDLQLVFKRDTSAALAREAQAACLQAF